MNSAAYNREHQAPVRAVVVVSAHASCSERNPAPLPVIVASVFKISGKTFATDASVIEADARLARRTEGKEPPDDWNDPGKVTRPVREYLDQLDKAAGLGALPGESPQPPKSLWRPGTSWRR